MPTRGLPQFWQMLALSGLLGFEQLGFRQQIMSIFRELAEPDPIKDRAISL
jgi:hypothetical protein